MKNRVAAILVLSALAVTAAGAPAATAAAGDPQAAAFKKLIKSTVGDLKAQSGAALVSVKTALKAASDGYGDASLDGIAAVDAAVAALTTQRDLLEDADWLQKAIRATDDALPAPKPKKPRKPVVE